MTGFLMAPVQHELYFPHLGAFVSCGLSQNETLFSDSGHSPLTKLWSLRTLKEQPACLGPFPHTPCRRASATASGSAGRSAPSHLSICSIFGNRSAHGRSTPVYAM